MATVHDQTEFVRRWHEEVWGKRNLDAVDEYVAEEFVLRDPGLPEPIRGPAGVREVIEMLQSAFPDVQVELDDMLSEGDWVAVRASATGTHDGEYVGIEPTGEEVTLTIMAFQRIENGQFVEEYQQVDRLGLLRQLGVVEPPGTDQPDRP